MFLVDTQLGVSGQTANWPIDVGVFPAQENFYEIKDEELEKLLGDKKWKYELDNDYYNLVFVNGELPELPE